MNLALDFEEASDSGGMLAIETRCAVTALAAPFQESMQQGDSCVRAVRYQAPKAAKLAAFPSELNPALHSALAARGIENLYTHQAAAVKHALAGRNTVVVTPTASGKTLCYNLPVVNAILCDRAARGDLPVSHQGACRRSTA
ncbi:MAG: DEAD/DEAH box helicase [Bryobacteraceae bacterium]